MLFFKSWIQIQRSFWRVFSGTYIGKQIWLVCFAPSGLFPKLEHFNIIVEWFSTTVYWCDMNGKNLGCSEVVHTSCSLYELIRVNCSSISIYIIHVDIHWQHDYFTSCGPPKSSCQVVYSSENSFTNDCAYLTDSETAFRTIYKTPVPSTGLSITLRRIEWTAFVWKSDTGLNQLKCLLQS